MCRPNPIKEPHAFFLTKFGLAVTVEPKMKLVMGLEHGLNWNMDWHIIAAYDETQNKPLYKFENVMKTCLYESFKVFFSTKQLLKNHRKQNNYRCNEARSRAEGPWLFQHPGSRKCFQVNRWLGNEPTYNDNDNDSNNNNNNNNNNR